MSEKSAFSLLNPSLVENLKKINITEPTPVQNTVIPKILNKENIVFQSETGTGKTFAFALPLISNILNSPSNSEHAKIMIISPTFELSSQIKQAILSLTNLKTALFIGGTPLKRQIETLKEKPEIVIGTTVRLTELILLKKLKVQNLQTVVFDEADRLLKKESKSETEKLLSLLPKDIQTIACSATIDKNTKNFFKSEVVLLPPEDILKTRVTHWAIFSEKRDKIDTLRKFIYAENPEKLLIFTSRPQDVENIYSKLKYKKINCTCLHSKNDKQERKTAIDRFKSGKEKILITSDLSSRGLDIQNISHIVQMDLPENTDFFIHRAGRTARAGKKGINVVIGDEFEMQNYSKLEKKLNITVYPKEIYKGKIIEPSL